jgi:hypothetical protein
MKRFDIEVKRIKEIESRDLSEPETQREVLGIIESL